MSTARTERSRLGDLLVEMRLVDEAVMRSVVAEQRSSGRRLARILAERRLIDEERLTRAVASKLGVDAVSVAGVRIHDRVLGLIPPAMAQVHGVLPVAIKRTNQNEVVYLVMTDPLDTNAINEVQRVTGREIRVLMGKASEVDDAIAQHYGPSEETEPTTVDDPSEGRASFDGRPRRPGGAPRPRVGSAPSPVSGTRPGPAARSAAGRLQLSALGTLSPSVPVSEPPPLAPAAPPPPPVTRVDDDVNDEVATARPGEVPAEVTVEDSPGLEAAVDAGPPPLHESKAPERAPTRIDDRFGRLEERLKTPGEADEWERSVRQWEGSAFAGEPRDPVEPPAPAAADDEEDAPATGAGRELHSAADGLDWGQQIDIPTPANKVAPPSAESRPPRRLLAATLEIPVNWDEESHPFQGPVLSQVRVGLERTAIIPADELANAEFEPPPLVDPPSAVASALAGQDDIPTSTAAVEARAVELADDPEPADEEPEIEEVALEPIADADVVSLDGERELAESSAATDARPIPVLEPSSLPSLIDEADTSQRDTGADALPLGGARGAVDDMATHPRIDGQLLRSALTASSPVEAIPETKPVASSRAETVLSPMKVGLRTAPKPSGPSAPPLKSAKPARGDEATRHATSMVAALRSGASLSSPQRAELVLALGRLLLDKGVITEAELLKALLD